MIHKPLALACTLALATAYLTACENVSGATEQELIQRAKDYQDKGNTRSSIIELKSALQKNPDSAEARQLLGMLYLKTKRGEEAEKELTHALQLGSNREALLPLLGEAYLLMNDPQRVLDEIQLGDQTTPLNRARILQLRGHALLKKGQLTEGCNLFDQALQSSQVLPETFWGLAQCAVIQRDMTKARAWLARAEKLPDQRARTYLLVGEWEALNNNLPGALAAYTKALKLEPDDLEVLQSRATLNLKTGQIEAANQDIKHVEKLVPNTPPAFYLRAMAEYQKKNYPAARDALQDVLKQMTGHYPSILLAGSTAYELAAYEQAESHLKRYLGRYPGEAFAIRILAATYIRQNQPEQALEILTPLLGPSSKDVQAFILAGEARRAMNDPARAGEWLARAAALDPDNSALRTRIGLNFLGGGDYSAGLQELQHASSMAPEKHEADNLLALAHLERKQYDKALSVIERMLQKLPDNPAVIVLRGQAYAGKGDFVLAAQSFDKALALKPDFYPAASSLAQLDLAAQKPKQAANRYETFLRKNKNHMQATLALAQLRLNATQPKVALQLIEQAAKAHPKAIEPYQSLVSYYLTQQDTARALASANEAMQTHPDNPVALDMLGSAQLAAGQTDNALISATRLAEKLPRSASAHVKLALLQTQQGQPALAKASLNRALALQPSYPPALEALVKTEIQSGQPEQALKIARQFQTAYPQSATGFQLEGNAYLAGKQPAAAAKSYERAFALEPLNTVLINWHQADYLATGGQAMDSRLHQWLKAQPGDYTVRGYLAQHYVSTKRIPEAIAEYQLLMRQLPDNVLVLNNLASLYQQTRDARALSIAEKAHRLSPKNPATQDTLGWILLERGQHSRALELIRSAVVAQPGIPTLRYHLAAALAKTGAKPQARVELQKLLKAHPVFPEAREAQALFDSL